MSKLPVDLELCRITAQRDLLRQSLVDLVGVSERKELEIMEGEMRAMPGPLQDKVVSINAIHALLYVIQDEENNK